MSRRGSIIHGVGMNRVGRGSEAGIKGSRNRAGSKTEGASGASTNRSAAGDLKDGDIFYRTVRIYPSVSYDPVESHVTATKSLDPGTTPALFGGIKMESQRKMSEMDLRRFSVIPGRDDFSTPDDHSKAHRCC